MFLLLSILLLSSRLHLSNSLFLSISLSLPPPSADAKGDLKSVAQVEALRDKVYAVLEEYCKLNYPDEPGRFAKLLLRLPALRSIGLKCLEHLFFFKLIGDTPIDQFLHSILEVSSDS